MRIFNLEITLIPAAPPEPGIDPNDEVYMDACALLVRAYRGKPWSRRRGGMKDVRWRPAYALLRASEVVRGRDMIYVTYREAIGLLWMYHVNQTTVRNAGRYVPATPENPPPLKLPVGRAGRPPASPAASPKKR